MDFNPAGAAINVPQIILPSHNRHLLYPELYGVLTKCKSGIKNNDEWDKIKKLGNPYELIHISNRSNYNSIAKYCPVSRSYFKLWEILNDFANILPKKSNAVVANLAEGPGGFMEAIVNYRKEEYSDKLFGITLESTNKYIPGWNIKGDNVDVSYGNIYEEKDITDYVGKIMAAGGADLITADGGFDYSIDFNNQEQQSYRIIYAELTCGLMMQKLGGTLICKIFDTFTEFTVKLMYLLYCLYDKIYIVKPKTSRPANSEKYVLAMGFKGIERDLLESMKRILFNWSDEIVNLDGIVVAKEFVKALDDYNRDYVKNQIYYLNSIIDLIENKPTKMMYRNIIKRQATSAVEWCNRYGMIINKDSKYLNY